MTLKKWFNNWLKSNKYTYRSLARKLDLSYQTIVKLSNGGNGITDNTVSTLCSLMTDIEAEEFKLIAYNEASLIKFQTSELTKAQIGLLAELKLCIKKKSRLDCAHIIKEIYSSD